MLKSFARLPGVGTTTMLNMYDDRNAQEPRQAVRRRYDRNAEEPMHDRVLKSLALPPRFS